MQRILPPIRRLLDRLLHSVELPAPETPARRQRLLAVERNLVLPIKVILTAVIFHSLQTTPWIGTPLGSLEVTITSINTLFGIYTVLNVVSAILLLSARRLPFPVLHWTVFAMSLVDAVFFGALTLVGGGYDSPLFWVFLLLILRNAAANPPVWSQLVLNLCISLCFGAAGFLDIELSQQVREELTASATPLRLRPLTNSVSGEFIVPPTAGIFLDIEEDSPAEDAILRLIVLALASVCLYAMQVLVEKQRLTAAEAAESSSREAQLRSAGRLAAEFAHQIKNPLAIINNASFSLRRGLKTGKGDPQRQLDIITEEVERADRIITQVMGYGELTEGHVERLDLVEEIRRARARTFPDGIGLAIDFHLNARGPFPPLLMQRRHLAEIFLNLFQNAREALNGRGAISVTARVRPDEAIEVVVQDNGPGIPSDKLGRVFESYFTTKQRGTGLGLSIVKNNVELYGGSVRAESELGKGARFTLVFPAKASSTPGA